MKAEKKEKYSYKVAALWSQSNLSVNNFLFHPDTKLFSEMNTIGMLVKNLKYGTHISRSKV